MPYLFANNAQTTLSSAMTALTTSMSVTDASSFPALNNFVVRVDDELMFVQAGAGTTSWTVARASEDASRYPAASHSAGATVTLIISAAGLTSLHPESAVSVKDFGAKGDGSTDDTNAFVQAIGSTERIFIPKGDFLVSAAALSLVSSQELFGEGYLSRVTIQGAGNGIEVIGTSGAHLDHAVIRNFRLTGPSVSGSVAGSGVYLDYADFCDIDDMDISGFGSLGDDGTVHFHNVTSSRVRRGRHHDSLNGPITGVATNEAIVADSCEWSDNESYNNVDDGFHDQHGTHSRYTRNLCHNNGESGIDLLGASHDVLSGNVSYGNGHAGIEIGNTATATPDSYHTITGNVLSGNTLDGVFAGGFVESCVVADNAIQGNQRYGIMFGPGASGLVEKSLIAGNNIVGNTTDGIRLSNAVNACTVRNNVVRDNGGRGIYIVNAGVASPTGNIVKQNTVLGNTTAQVAQNGDTNSTVADNETV